MAPPWAKGEAQATGLLPPFPAERGEIRAPMEWNVRVESRLARIEAALEDMREHLARLQECIDELRTDISEQRAYKQLHNNTNSRLARLENHYATLDRRLERVYAVGAVLAFLVTALAALLTL